MFEGTDLPLCGGTNNSPRVNCMRLIDMPLCSAISPQGNINAASTTNLSGNCVPLCSDINPPAVPAYGSNCIRFCDSPPDHGVTMNPGTNCTSRKCHQFGISEVPDKNSNCNIIGCNLLTKDELNDNKFMDESKQYCSDNSVKCYSFSKDKLPYLRYRSKNPMCQIHSCRPDSPACGEDETTKITNQPTDYQNDYIRYINAGMDINSGFCKRVVCKPIIYVQYRCSPASDPKPQTKAPLCNRECSSDGYCTEKVDCNDSDYRNREECQASMIPDGNNDLTDTTNSWFYRPVPPTADVINNINKTNLCYTTDQMRAHDWGWTPQWPFDFLGYFHNAVRSPGHCDAPRLGVRGNGYAYMCGTDGSLYTEPGPNSDSGYIQGFVKANYENPEAQYKITACLRFKNSGRLSACGARECSIECGFGLCGTQWCGFDKCLDLNVKDGDPKECSLKENSDLFNGTSYGCAANVGGGADGQGCRGHRLRQVRHHRAELRQC